MNKKSSKKLTNYDFHLRNIKELIEIHDLLKNISGFNLSDFYSRKDNRGWWMVTKEILIKKYIAIYLNILGGRKNPPKLIYIDLLSSSGMNQITKEDKKHEFIFPGSAISAAMVSQKKRASFDKYYCNDGDYANRSFLINRYNSLNNSPQIIRKIDFSIESTPKFIDSNVWIKNVIIEIKNNYPYRNCLVVIDNEGMAVKFDTIKLIHDELEYVDLVINLQVQDISRIRSNQELTKSFFGKDLPPEVPREELLPIYQKQLENIGFKSESIKVDSKNYFYYLLFCCRKGVSGEWLDMIRKYSDERFKNWLDSNVKTFWDLATNKIQSLPIL